MNTECSENYTTVVIIDFCVIYASWLSVTGGHTLPAFSVYSKQIL